MKKRAPAFPRYLNEDSNGLAVFMLQALLFSLGTRYSHKLEIDGVYGPRTFVGVKTLQGDLGFKGNDIDGNFGPKTRKALFARRGIDVNAIPLPTLRTIWLGPHTRERRIHPKST